MGLSLASVGASIRPVTAWWQRVLAWEHSGLFFLVVLTIVLHFSVILQPQQLVFDEQHYIKDARVILSGAGTERPEHPPLAKLMIAGGVFLFGDSPLGWRLFPIVLGVASLVLFYFICRKLGMHPEATLLASFLFSLENLTFIQASIAMLDIYFLFFMLSSFLLYLDRRFIPAGIAVALSSLSKLYGVLALPVMFVHWLWTRKTRVEFILITGVISAIAFLGLLTLLNFVIWRQWSEPLSLIKTMLSLSGSLTFANNPSSVISRPWDWVLMPLLIYYWYDPHYVGAISFTVWALIIPSVLYMLYRGIKGDNAGRFGIAWFFGTYLLWIPMSIVTDRISFVFYFYPTVGAVCIGIALGLSRLMDVWRTRPGGRGKAAYSLVVGYLLAHVLVFIILSPVFSRWIPLFRAY